MNFDILIIIIILLFPFVSMFYFAHKYNIYRYYGFKSLLKIIKESSINNKEKKKIIKSYFIFWTLVFTIVLYLCFVYMILTNNWSLI